MNRFKIVLTIILIASISDLHSQITFQRGFGGLNLDEGHSIQITYDGGYIIAGSTMSYGAGNLDFYLLKTDSFGNLLWTKTFGGPNIDEAWSVRQTNDSGFILAGFTTSFGAGYYDAYVIKTDANGDSLWSKTYGGINADLGRSIMQTADGGYTLGGYENSSGNGQPYFLINLDSVGNFNWSKTYGGNGTAYAYSIHQTNDGGYILTGEAGAFGSIRSYLVKTDSVGDSLWTKTFRGNIIDLGNDAIQTTDGGYIIVGNTLSFGAGSYDVYVIKTDSNGDSLWTKAYGSTGTDYGNSIFQTFDGGYIIAGQTSGFGAGSWDVYLIKINANGNLIWSKAYGNIYGNVGLAVRQTADSGFIVTGYTNSGHGDNVLLLKTDANGNVGCDEANALTIVSPTATVVELPPTDVHLPVAIVTLPVTQVNSGGSLTYDCATTGIYDSPIHNSGISVYSNTYSNDIKISGTLEKGLVLIYDVSGKEMLRQKTQDIETIIITKDFINGFYILCYVEENKMQNIKFIKASN